MKTPPHEAHVLIKPAFHPRPPLYGTTIYKKHLSTSNSLCFIIRFTTFKKCKFSRSELRITVLFNLSVLRNETMNSKMKFIQFFSQHSFLFNAKLFFAEIFVDKIKRYSKSIMIIWKSWFDDLVGSIFKIPYFCDERTKQRFLSFS